MKTLVVFYKMNVDYTFNSKIYIQTEALAMGSPLGSILVHMSFFFKDQP